MRIPFFAALAAVAMVAPLGCGPSIPAYDPANYKKEYDPRAHQYVIGVGDSLHINVWKTPDLTSTEIVRPDGTITLALIGDIQAADKTTTQVRDAIRAKLSDFIKDESTVVTVSIQSVGSYRYIVSGNVTRPGEFNSKYYVTISQAIAMAGGPTRFAETGAVLLLRPEGNGKIRRIPVDYDKISSQEAPEQDLVISRGDTVYVP